MVLVSRARSAGGASSGVRVGVQNVAAVSGTHISAVGVSVWSGVGFRGGGAHLGVFGFGECLQKFSADVGVGGGAHIEIFGFGESAVSAATRSALMCSWVAAAARAAAEVWLAITVNAAVPKFGWLRRALMTRSGRCSLAAAVASTAALVVVLLTTWNSVVGSAAKTPSAVCGHDGCNATRDRILLSGSDASAAAIVAGQLGLRGAAARSSHSSALAAATSAARAAPECRARRLRHPAADDTAAAVAVLDDPGSVSLATDGGQTRSFVTAARMLLLADWAASAASASQRPRLMKRPNTSLRECRDTPTAAATSVNDALGAVLAIRAAARRVWTVCT